MMTTQDNFLNKGRVAPFMLTNGDIMSLDNERKPSENLPLTRQVTDLKTDYEQP